MASASQHIIERRVGRDATVPEMLAVNFDGRKPGGNAPEAMICSGPIFLPSFLNSKLSKYLKLPLVTLTAPTLSRSSGRDPVEIDQALQCFFKRRGVVIALRLWLPWGQSGAGEFAA